MLNDPLFRVEVLAKTPNPQQLIYAGMHQDYSERFVYDERGSFPDETKAGEIAVKRLLSGERGHYGCLEHPQITFSTGYFPHSVLQQARTHRVAVSFDVQCMSSDTLITRVLRNGKIKDKVTIEEIYKLHNNGQKILLRSLDEEGNRFVPNEVEAVISSGVKRVFLVQTDLDRSIKATPEHRVLTTSGWKEIKDLKEGDFILSNGKPPSTAKDTYQSKQWLEAEFSKGRSTREIAFELGVQTQTIKKWAYIHKLDWEKKIWNKGTTYTLFISDEERERRRIHAKRLNSSLIRKSGPDHPSWKVDLPEHKRAYNWLKYERANFLERAENKCEECGCEHERLHCHHIKPVRLFPGLGTDPENIVVLCPSCHKKAHYMVPSAAMVVSVTEIGECETYDIAMKAPYHNFVADGLVVHNSMRYTGNRIIEAASGTIPLEEVFYLRPPGYYSDRQGKKYSYTADQREIDWQYCRVAAERYRELLLAGFAEEHARSILPFDYRQHFVVSFTLRSFLHFTDLRAKLDAQEEIRVLCEMMWPHAKAWVPEIAAWYEKSRLHKARLAP
jgi:thymidylate synthase (FAD)